MNLLAREPEPNACRHRGQPGHVESYFLRCNHPTRPLALWVKATILAPLEGAAVAETWMVWFDGERGQTLAQRHTDPLAGASFPPLTPSPAPPFTPSPSRGAPPTHLHGLRVVTPRLQLDLGAAGSLEAAVATAAGDLACSLSFRDWPGAVGQPLALLPWRLLREGPFPRSKLLTPRPALAFSGTVRLPGGETVAVDAWPGMQGHNWGREHAFDYAWGQCLFPSTATSPAAMVEGFSARVKVAGRTTPRLSALVVRRGDEEHRFDALFDAWRQEASLTRHRWTVRLRGSAGEVRLRMDATGQPEACLGYRNPDGHLSYCFNSKLADTLVEVWPARGQPFTLRSPHGGALEFLRTQGDPALPVV